MCTIHVHGLRVSKRSGMQEHAWKLPVRMRSEVVRFALYEKEERLQRGNVVGAMRQRRVHQSTVDGRLHVHLQSGQYHAVTRKEECGRLCSYYQLSCNCILSLKGWTTTNSRQHPACTKDVDECKENKHTCSTNPLVECRNTRGSFTCGNCPTGNYYTPLKNLIIYITRTYTSRFIILLGFEGDGFVCTDVNECLINNGGCSVNPRVQCINTRVRAYIKHFVELTLGVRAIIV